MKRDKTIFSIDAISRGTKCQVNYKYQPNGVNNNNQTEIIGCKTCDNNTILNPS